MYGVQIVPEMGSAPMLSDVFHVIHLLMFWKKEYVSPEVDVENIPFIIQRQVDSMLPTVIVNPDSIWVVLLPVQYVIINVKHVQGQAKVNVLPAMMD